MLYYLIVLLLVGKKSASLYIDCRRDSGSKLYVVPYSGCQQYYSCDLESVNYYQCPPGTIFNNQLNKCSISGSCYELVCAGRRDGIYPDTTENCTRFYSCIGGFLASLHSCPQGTIFSDNRCRSALKASCEPIEAALYHRQHDLCENHLDGYLALADCSAYVLCSRGIEKQIFICPPGLKFNGTHCTEYVSCDNFCSNKHDGNYYDIDTGCSEYINCSNGAIYNRFKCPSGTIFNGVYCVIETSFQCPQTNICKDKANGLYSDYSSSCKSYYQCENGLTKQKMKCGEGQVWNGKECVSENLFRCEDPVFSVGCLGKKGFFVNKLNCSNYFYCSFGLKTSFACPDNLTFNGSSCEERKKYIGPNFGKNYCEDKQEGYYVDTESNCQSYYYCARGIKLTYVCPFGQLYNGEQCVSKLSYNCPFSSSDCQNISDGYHKSKNSNSDYVYCQNGIKLSTFKCKSNEVFDGEKCTIIIDEESNICKHTEKGYVSDSDCKKYFLCKEHAILETNICADKYIFNGKECVPAGQYKCPNNECTNLADGFYQDLKSNCRKYFYCINGYKTILTCPAGKVHNGNLCVPEEIYTCKTKLPSNDNVIYVT
ncbi:zonadhesin-like isoform X2 [Rhodnius prolixus]|uniref:zonadhesin-like isoform X2 n=1 Tax=Rhodnius prolixus TaxID=13249 RepID=UPI003D18957A